MNISTTVLSDNFFFHWHAKIIGKMKVEILSQNKNNQTILEIC